VRLLVARLVSVSSTTLRAPRASGASLHRLLAAAVAIAFFVATPGRGHAQQDRPSALAGLREDHLLALRDLGTRIDGLGRWTTTEFKSEVWGRLGAWLWQTLRTASEAEYSEEVFRELHRSRLHSLIPDELRSRDRVPSATDPAVDEIRISQVALEARLLADAVYPFLRDELREWQQALPTEPDVRAAVEDALRTYQQLQSDLALVVLALEQPDWVLGIIGLDRGALRSLADSPASLKFTQTDFDLSDPQQLQAIARRIVEPASPSQELIRDARSVASTMQVWYSVHGREIDELMRAYSAVSAATTRDLPETLSDALYFRWRVVDGSGITAAGEAASTIELTLGLPYRGSALVSVPADGIGLPGSDVSEELVFEVPTGIRVNGAVGMDSADLLTIVPRGIRNNVNNPRDQLRTALESFGYPSAIRLDSVDLVGLEDLYSMTLRYSARIPGLDVNLTSELRIDAGDPLLGTTVDEIRAQLARTLTDGTRAAFAEAVAGRTITAQLLGGPSVVLSGLAAVGDWHAGNVGISARIDVPGYGAIPARLWVRRRGSAWALEAEVSGELDDIATRLRLELSAKVAAIVTATGLVESTEVATEQLQDFLGVTDLTIDDRQGRLRGEANFRDVSLLFSVGLHDGDVRLDNGSEITGILTASVQGILADLGYKARNAVGIEAFCRSAVGSELSVLGASFSVDSATLEEHPASRCRVGGALGLPGRNVEIAGIIVRDFPQSENRLDPDALDFSEARWSPDPVASLREYIGGTLQIADRYLDVDDVRATVEGFRARVRLRIDGLSSSVPAVDVFVGRSGIDVAGVEEALEATLVSALTSSRLVPSDLGPVDNLRVSEFRLRPAVTVVLEGDLPIADLFDLPFSLQLAPYVGRLQFRTDGIESLLDPLVAGLLPEAIEGVRVGGYDLLTTAPYGIRARDVSLDVWEFNLTLEDVLLTQNGVRIPPQVSFRIPATYPLPGGFAIVRPGVSVHLDGKTSLSLLGDLTYGGEGVDKIAKVASSITAPLDVADLAFSLEGKLIVLDAVTLFSVRGTADFTRGRLELDARTVGEFRKIIDLSGRTLADANAQTFDQMAKLKLLGIRLLDARARLDVRRQRFSTFAAASIPLADVNFGVTASPDLSSTEASGAFAFSVGDFDIAGAHIRVTVAIVDTGFEALGFGVRVIAPSISTMTPDRVLHALLAAFDFDIAAFLDALANRRITISFFDDSGRPVGDGDPLPMSSPADSNTDRSSEPEPREVEPDGQPGPEEPTSSTLGKVEASSNGVAPEVEIPVRAYRYLNANSVLDFTRDPDFDRWVPVIVSANARWEEHLAVTERLKNQIVSGWTVLDRFEVFLPSPIKCRHGFDWREVPAWILYRAAGTVAVVLMYGEGSIVELASTGGNELGDSGSSAQERYTEGDIRVLRDIALSTILETEPRVEDIDRVEPQAYTLVGGSGSTGVITLPGGYFYDLESTAAEHVRGLVFQSRASERAEFEDDPRRMDLYDFVRDRGASELSRRVLAVSLDARLKGGWATLLWGEPSKRVLLYRETVGPSGRSELVYIDTERLATVAMSYIDEAAATAGWSLISEKPTRTARPSEYPQQDAALSTSLAERVSTGAWEELVLGVSDRASIAVLAAGLGAANWKIEVIRTSPAGTRPPTIHAVAGEEIERLYAAWWEPPFRAIHEGAPSSMATEHERHWLLRLSVAPPVSWTRYFEANPLGLLLTPR